MGKRPLYEVGVQVKVFTGKGWRQGRIIEYWSPIQGGFYYRIAVPFPNEPDNEVCAPEHCLRNIE